MDLASAITTVLAAAAFIARQQPRSAEVQETYEITKKLLAERYDVVGTEFLDDDPSSLAARRFLEREIEKRELADRRVINVVMELSRLLGEDPSMKQVAVSVPVTLAELRVALLRLEAESKHLAGTDEMGSSIENTVQSAHFRTIISSKKPPTVD